MTDDSDILRTKNQVKDFLVAEGYQVSYGKIRDDVKRGALLPRAGQGFTKRDVLAYATLHIKARVIDDSPKADAPRAAPVESGAANRRVSADADLKEIAATRSRFALARELGRYVEAETVEAELSARAKAFRIGLEKFGHDMAEPIAAVFGADAKAAAELARRLGLDEEATAAAVPVIIDFVLSRCDRFRRKWAGRVDGLLDAYSTGAWWDDDMREAWDKYQAHAHEEVPRV
ncbi:hypothetical protein [Nitratidesulfovibrio liaohensis]|uniref:Uncharacterized protein n=1 Tax=Nitratidesulfovibrio liaohensis TaxID=2604158 RepID=A0ABY9QYZ9_9BACT|nr:hypothetical protein [Nitratidesulfovibrio liaohensis]WMW64414.1 hypothetical protein KPS_002427 [Nitratidesulfovibrio liaohensis]